MKLSDIRNTKKKIVIFGAGNDGTKISSEKQFVVSYFVDNDVEKQNKYIDGILVNNPSILLKEKKHDLLIIVASLSCYSEIALQLKEMDFKEAEHFFIYGISIVDSYYEKNEPHASYAPWNEDNLFLATYRTIKQNTLVDKYRCFELWSIIEQVSNLNGALIEIGVWRGGTGALIATKAKLCDIEDTVYLCDTFTGVVKAGSNDSFYIGGEHKDTSIESVESLLGEMSLENAQILKGIFPDDTADLINEEVFRFCHIDVDVYNSAQQIFDWIWGKMVVGGIIVYDDYGFSKCDGITKHVNQLKTRSDLIYIHNLNGHALFIKIS